MANDNKPDQVRLYVCNALRILLRGHDPDLLQKSKGLDNIPEIASDRQWMDFVAAVHDENNSWTEPHNSVNARYYKRFEDWRHAILIEMFRKYELIK